jgi:hypothetical protein
MSGRLRIDSVFSPTRYALLYSLGGSGFGFLNSLLHVYFIGLDGVATYFLLSQIATVNYLAIDERYVNSTWLAGRYVGFTFLDLTVMIIINTVILSSLAVLGIDTSFEIDGVYYIVLSYVLALTSLLQNRLDAFFKSISGMGGVTSVKVLRLMFFPLVTILYMLGGLLLPEDLYILSVIFINFIAVLYLYKLIPNKLMENRSLINRLSEITKNSFSAVSFYYVTRVWSAVYISPVIYSALNFGWRFAGPMQHILVRYRQVLNQYIGRLQILSVLLVSIFSIFIQVYAPEESLILVLLVVSIVALDRSVQASARMFYMASYARVLAGERRFLLLATGFVIGVVLLDFIPAFTAVMLSVSYRGLLSLYASRKIRIKGAS